MKKNIKKYIYLFRDILIIMVIALALNMFIEYIKFGEIIKTIQFFKVWKIAAVNYLIILSTLLISIYFKRKYFVVSLISIIWLIISTISKLISNIRGIPLRFSDIYSISDGLSIANEYISINTILPIVILLIIFILFLTYIYKFKSQLSIASKLVSLLVIITTTLSIFFIREKRIFEVIQLDLKGSYDFYGFSYSIMDSILTSINRKPNNYNKLSMNEIKQKIQLANKTEEDLKYKNIIFIQLESVMDPAYIDGVEFNKDPLKNFKEISSNAIYGDLKVPAFGGQTVRTEFEVLTSQNLEYRPSGEIPYVRELGNMVIESIPNILNKKGYESTVIHNFQGNFYNRHDVFDNLGFDTYIPMEYMKNIDVESWIYQNDSLIFDSIIEVMENNNQNKFIHAITVGTHGPYKLENIKKEEIKIIENSKNISSENIGKITDYVNRLYLLDKEIGEFIDYVNDLDEETLVVMYSDHLPSIYETQNEDYNKDIYEAPYFIYSNKENEIKKIDMKSYQLSTYIFDMMGIEGGVMNKLHASYNEHSSYQEYMELLQYDITFGEKYVYDNGEVPYEKSDMVLGLNETLISNYEIVNDTIKILGSGFNDASIIYINDKKIDTKYMSDKKLEGNISNVKSIKDICVKQIGQHDIPLGSTNVIEIE